LRFLRDFVRSDGKSFAIDHPQSMYPKLSKMASGTLAVPATGTSIDREGRITGGLYKTTKSVDSYNNPRFAAI